MVRSRRARRFPPGRSENLLSQREGESTMPPKPRNRFLRPFTTHLFNPISRRVVGHLPGFGIISYIGRKSGKRYRTPMNVFRRGDDYVFALT